jgi:hypothetical protein
MIRKNLSLLLITSMVLFIFGSSFYFGYKYAVFNTDFHHYSFTLESFLDFKNGFKLNKDIFIQYGNGQVYLFAILSNFFEINLFTIGVVTQFLFSLKFIIFFFILRFFVDNLFSIIGVIIYYLLYTFTQTISSDIYASFFLHLFVLLYLYNYKKNNFYLIILTSFLIFLTVFFRHTYLLNWVAFILILIFINFFLNKEFKYENKIIINFCIILGLYFLYLIIDGRLFLWFDQFLGVGLNAHLEIGNGYEMDFISRVKKLTFYFLRIIRHAIWPNSYGSNYFFTAIFITNLIFIFSLSYKFFFKNINDIKEKNKLLFILSLIGFCGSIQVIHNFEISRYINASFTFLIIFIYILQLIFNNLKNGYSKYLFLISILIFSTPLTIYPPSSILAFHSIKLKYPFQSNFFNFKLGTNYIYKNTKDLGNTKFDFNNNLFLEPTNKIFKGKRLTQEYLDFYEDIEKDICNYSAIYNFSFDRTLHYLCADQKKYIPSLMPLRYVTQSLTEQQVIMANNLNAVLLSHDKIPTLEILKIYNVPRFYRYNKSDTTMSVYSDKIYTYEIN